ncbi:hypothetical protein NQ317_016176 [Molorchus minor]|uniref:BRCT domain-containing protein n=1 Tax=Molorchus minor TaxID=1323400 RepID=A0ABQ9JRB6_9CUCU|nr:hypothetical protein NQ317_016176 [Molorchus minor]
MKPKYSSEYLTPQANRRRSKRVSTSFQSDVNTENNFTESFFEKLMTCPVKRQLVLNLISSEKENIKEYNRKQAEEEKRKQHDGSPLGKLHESINADDRESCSSSQQSGDSGSASPLLFNNLLDGVIAYVEVRSKDQDRSNGAKALMRSMGATVRDQFTKDVTHVIFKDGSFTTYQKAKLMNVHLVSVLWIEAVRSSNMRVSEKKFPALGTEAYDHNVCKEITKKSLEKRYAEVWLQGLPLPSTKSLIGRRRTIMTPSTSRQFSQDFPSSQDKEVEQIINSGRITYDYGISTLRPIKSSPEFTSDDDSDLGPCINGTIVERTQSNLTPIQEYAAGATSSVEKSSDPNIELAYIETSKSLTDLIDVDQDEIVYETINERNNVSTPDILTDSIYNRSTPKLKSTLNSKSKSSFNITEDNSFSIPDENLYRRHTRQLKSNTNNSAKKRQEAVSNNSVYILSKNLYVNLAKPLDSCSNPLSSLQLSSEKDTIEISTSTNMSSLQISASNKEQNNIAKASMALNEYQYVSPCYFVRFSHVKSKTSKEKSFNSTSGDSSFSPLNINVIKNVLQSLEDSPKSDENVTRRRGGQIKSALPIGNANPCSLVEASPPKQRKSTRRKTLLSPCPQLTDEGSSSDDKSINSGQQSRDIQSDSELPTVKKSSRNRRKTFHHTDKSQLDNVGSKKVNKSCSEDSDVSEKKKKEGAEKKKIEPKRESVNSDDDEQHELAQEILNKKANNKPLGNLKKSVAKSEGRVKRRQSVRLSQYANKKLNFNSSTSSNDEKKRITVNSKNRRSTLEFQPLSQKSAKNKLKIDKCKQPTIIVKKLGGFVIEDEVSERTTHLVAGEPKRTINMLRAIARGCWIVKQEWLFKSLEEQKWLPEEDYEETDFSCAVQVS